MELLYSIAIISIIFQAERGIFDTLSLIRLLKILKTTKDDAIYNMSEKQIVHVIIPVYGEQPIIEKTIHDILQIRHPSFVIKIIIVTSIRESKNVKINTLTTEDVLLNSISNGELRPWKDRISILQDMNEKGNMATQLNFAICHLDNSGAGNDYYVIYNADSIISKNTFQALNKLLSAGRRPMAFQQPCAFIKDAGKDAPNFLNALSLYQTFYCLGHESRIIHNYEKRVKKAGAFRHAMNLGVVVGHGSGMPVKINRAFNGYPTDMLTEDLTFGYMLSAASFPILSLPALEIADVPKHFLSFILQRSVWFWNYVGYFKCFDKLRKNSTPLPILINLSARGLGRGLYWLMLSIFTISPIVIGISLKSPFVISASILSVAIFSLFPIYILLKLLPTTLKIQGFSKHADSLRKISFIKILAPMIIIIFTDSLGAWIGTFQAIVYYISGALPKKYKTED